MPALITKVVVFGGEENDSATGVSIVFDNQLNVKDDGSEKSEFAPDESCYLLAIVPDTYHLLSVLSTDGSIAYLGPVTRTMVEAQHLFAEADKIEQLQQLPVGTVEPTWYGRSSRLDINKLDISAATVPCLTDLSYPYTALSYRLDPPAGMTLDDGEHYPIGVVLYVELVKL